MRVIRHILNCIVAALLTSQVFLTSVHAEEAELEALFEGLKSADPSAAEQIERRIHDIWSKSGSPSADLLLKRGRDALKDGESRAAVEHFTALIDHAPEFAEGYNGRATAFFQMQQYGLSLDDIQRTLALNPRHFAAMSGLALILEEIGMEQGALEAWRQVELIHPNRDGLQDAITRLERSVAGREL